MQQHRAEHFIFPDFQKPFIWIHNFLFFWKFSKIKCCIINHFTLEHLEAKQPEVPNHENDSHHPEKGYSTEEFMMMNKLLLELIFISLLIWHVRLVAFEGGSEGNTRHRKWSKKGERADFFLHHTNSLLYKLFPILFESLARIWTVRNGNKKKKKVPFEAHNLNPLICVHIFCVNFYQCSKNNKERWGERKKKWIFWPSSQSLNPLNLLRTSEGQKIFSFPHQNFIFHKSQTLDGWKLSILLSRLLLNKQTF